MPRPGQRRGWRWLAAVGAGPGRPRPAAPAAGGRGRRPWCANLLVVPVAVRLLQGGRLVRRRCRCCAGRGRARAAVPPVDVDRPRRGLTPVARVTRRRAGPRGAGRACGRAAGTRASARCRSRRRSRDCVMFLKNRSMRIFFSRGGQLLEHRLERLAVLHALEALVLDAEGLGRPASARRRCRVAGVQRQGAVGVRRLQALEHLLVGDLEVRRRARRRWARGRCFWDSSLVAAASESRSSCSRRGTRTAQPLSRKCRLISPTIVGVAYVENSTPRSRSNRSTDLIRPMVATCTRSS